LVLEKNAPVLTKGLRILTFRALVWAEAAVLAPTSKAAEKRSFS
jgi:hypothetical protein